MTRFRLLFLTLGLLLVSTAPALAELLALLNYESKPDQSVRREGIAIMDIDPESADFGKVLMEVPLPPDLVAHHIFFNRDRTKAYITALGKSVLHVVDLTRFPYRLRAINVPDCQALEDLVVSDDNRTWYLTCMGSSAVIMGDAVNDTPIKTVRTPGGGGASVNGHRGETDTIEKMQARVEYDLEYLRNWSLGLDLQIIVRTIRLVFFDRHAY